MLSSDYLGRNLEEKTKLSIGYLPILIKIFSEINKSLSDELKESLCNILNLYKDKDDAGDFQIQRKKSIDMVKTLGLLCDETMENV